jgi:dephospho-CoA kinase
MKIVERSEAPNEPSKTPLESSPGGKPGMRPQRGGMPVIGLTGGIACGKSTVAEVFRERGVRVIDADLVAREVTMPHEPALAALVREFGSDILLEDGTLDRKGLGAKVFGDPTAVAKLNAITHPAILARTGKRLADAQREGLGWVIYEAALILENRAEAGLSGLIVVLCPPESQRQRLMARNGLTPEEVERRIAAQTSDEVRRAKATWLIENDGDLPALVEKAHRLVDTLVEKYGAPGSLEQAVKV